MHLDRCVCVVKALEMPVLACISSSYSEVIEVEGIIFFKDICDCVHAKLW